MSNRPTGSLAIVQLRIDEATSELNKLVTAYSMTEQLAVFYHGLQHVMSAVELLTEAVQELKDRPLEEKLRIAREHKEERAA